MMPDLVNIAGIELLHPGQQAQRGEVARAGPHRRIEPRHGFEIVVEHVGPRGDHGLDRALLAQEIRRQHLDRRARAPAARMRRIAAREMPGAAVGQVVAIDRGHDDMARPSLPTASATLSGSCGSSRSGRPVATLQKAQARVQMSPRIMKVACFCFQHSPMFGQAASSQTVCSFELAHQPRVSWYSGESGALTRIQSGLRGTGIVRPVRLLGVADAAIGKRSVHCPYACARSVVRRAQVQFEAGAAIQAAPIAWYIVGGYQKWMARP